LEPDGPSGSVIVGAGAHAAEVKKHPKSKAAAKPKATKAAAGKKSSGKAGKDPNAPKRGLSA
jgi:hypothetical protein